MVLHIFTHTWELDLEGYINLLENVGATNTR